MLANRTLLITGGTGSFGNAMLTRVLRSDVAEIRVFSRDEKKQDDMRRVITDPRVRYHIGDVRDPTSVRGAMVGVDFVFHAAALKQVPSCEFFPMEAVRTNVIGTENVLDAAVTEGAQRVVVLSTDKAVYPINAMGMSKAMAEKVMVARSRSVPAGGPVLCATRYGNVMASRGSVIPLFIEQLMAGKEVTVTDPGMTRFLMSLDESVELVLQAFERGQQGDIFVQKSPASTVEVLVQALKSVLGRDNPVRIIGTRHGEKLYETLVSREEMSRAEQFDRYFRIPADTRDLDYRKYFVEGENAISEAEDYTSHNTVRLDIARTKELLLTLNAVQEALRA